MRSIFLIGGLSGFVLSAVTGILAGRESELILRDAAIGCIVGAVLFRWFWSVVVKALSETLSAKRAAQVAANQAAAAAAAAQPAGHVTTPAKAK
jgi:hypothetical protein